MKECRRERDNSLGGSKIPSMSRFRVIMMRKMINDDHHNGNDDHNGDDYGSVTNHDDVDDH